jgi:hypothetical protein
MDPSTAGSQSIPPLRSRDRRQLPRFGAFSPESGLGFCDLCDGAISAISSGRCTRRAETLDSIAFGVRLRFNGKPSANGHKKHKGAQKVKWEGMNQLCDVVRETSFAIHKYHRNGHLEKVYENALAHRLRKQ